MLALNRRAALVSEDMAHLVGGGHGMAVVGAFGMAVLVGDVAEDA
jgi:hypothetical protein